MLDVYCSATFCPVMSVVYIHTAVLCNILAMHHVVFAEFVWHCVLILFLRFYCVVRFLCRVFFLIIMIIGTDRICEIQPGTFV
jgi:hypothetical protein